MIKITFIGAGSLGFTRNVFGDCMHCEALKDSVFSLYDIDQERLDWTKLALEKMKENMGSTATIECFCGEEKRKEALRDATFVINTIQVGGYEPATVADFEIPKKYGLRQTIGDTLGIGGIMRALRTIPVMEAFAKEMEEVCPNAWLLNYTNPMAMVTGYIQKYTKVKTIGLCHSVQVCVKELLTWLEMPEKIKGHKELIAGINHMAWLLKLEDQDGNDLYPLVKAQIEQRLAEPLYCDKVRMDYIKNFGYYCTESSVHNAEYNPFYIKSKYPELIEKFGIGLDEYPRRCIEGLKNWKQEYEDLINSDKKHIRSREYASHIMEAIVTNIPYQIGGNVLNTGHLIENFPEDACVEVPCLIDGMGVHPCYVGEIPKICAAMNMSNINVQLLTIEAAHTKSRQTLYQAAMMDPHTGSELDIDSIKAMVDELLEAHKEFLPEEYV